ncbi:ankyrin repeat domain-containing protein [Thioclava sp. FR2]|uniref:ankyrin repeat domain-containing protein n=1 Tax=Thioclava sp. FR2 TaxID=3445780 RepID=UPI003EB88E11
MQCSSALVFIFSIGLSLPQPAIGAGGNPLCDEEFAVSATPKDIAGVVALGANPNEMCMPDGGAFGPGRSTPLFGYTLACIYRMESCEEWLGRMTALLEAGADPNIPDDRGETLLGWSVLLAHEAAIDILLDFDADPNLSDGEALHMAVGASFFVLERLDTAERYRLSLSIVRKLLAHGADPNMQNEDGETPLHEAVRHAPIEVIDALLTAGGDPSIQDSKGISAVDIARASGRSHLFNGSAD